MLTYDTAIIGGGAAGIVAAISAARKSASVIICERMPKLGKKILVSGGGRCNLSNEALDGPHYNREGRGLVRSVFARFGRDDISGFFKEVGLEMYAEGGRVFPVTDQSSSVLKVLEMELKRLSVTVDFGFEAADIAGGDGFTVTSKAGKKIKSDKLIIAGGGKSYPALGSDGSCYALAKKFGHSVIEPVPVAVPLTVKDPLCHHLQGQKIAARVKSIIDGNVEGEAAGELLFAKYGLSGTAILDISDEISIAIHRHNKGDVFVSADMVPFMEKGALESELGRRIGRKVQAEEMLAGILPNKFSYLFREMFKAPDTGKAAAALKDRRFKVLGTRGWNEAEFTAGGVDAGEVEEGTLESKLKEGLYFAGEILDVHGGRGGYNLAWAWASGFIAGLAE
ncbi:MAG: aminoacetone oxidase family FAD-binding enzyme [Candidatus Omnitrophica bacterium]|nr:aminoacetone oxidase family FAD-binding enzyme [Candidatus Omnitrophota bacterium]